MKISIYGGEAFPIYEIHEADDERLNLEIDDDVLKRWEQSFKDFSKTQEEIIEEMKKQGDGDQVWFGGCWEGFHI